ncbi:MAG: hypothetical protein KGJ84_12175 [Elusimicrobia bacterium]|nr:hypothetical protein [Elusimicrobiota bacterium]
MNKLLLTVVALAALAATARAQSESLAFGARGFEAAAAETISPFILEDAFAGVGACGVLDIKSFRAWTLQEAADMASPCLKAVGEKYQSSLVLQGGFLRATAAGYPATPGLLLKTDLTADSKPYRDLVSSLARRHNEILGHPVRLLARGEVAPESVSAVQEALKQCILVTVVRDIQNGSDFVKIYGRCLVKNPDLRIDAILPAPGMAVTLKTERTDVGAQALNGFVTVNAGKGPVEIMVVAQTARP